MSEQADLEAPFSLLWIRYNLRPPNNHGCFGVKLRQLVCGDMQLAVVSNYMIDFPWLVSACPELANAAHLVVVHGQDDAEMQETVATMTKERTTQVTVCRPPLPIQYGTHHSKFFILVYAAGVRVIVHTANLIFCDCNNKTQGLWFQDFPAKADPAAPASDFEARLCEYVRALRVPARAAAPLMAALGRHDFSAARGALVASTPGYHKGADIARAGHMRVRALLDQEAFAPAFRGAPLCCQFSSLGSLTERWLVDEFAASLSAGAVERAGPGRVPPLGAVRLGLPSSRERHKGIQLVWPTVNDVKGSFEGWAAGRSIPGFANNVTKPFLQQHWHKWDARFCHRHRAAPHIKTYCRYRGSEVAWLLLGSHNLSKAAWGELQKRDSQLMIRSYELSVLLLPSLEARHRRHAHHGFQCAPIDVAVVTTPAGGAASARSVLLRCPASTVAQAEAGGRGREDADAAPPRVRFFAAQQGRGVGSAYEGHTLEGLGAVVPLPMPYTLPPVPYEDGDEPWKVDGQYAGTDANNLTVAGSIGSSMYGYSQALVPPYFADNS